MKKIDWHKAVFADCCYVCESLPTVTLARPVVLIILQWNLIMWYFSCKNCTMHIARCPRRCICFANLSERLRCCPKQDILF